MIGIGGRSGDGRVSECLHGSELEVKEAYLEILSDLTDETLERKLPDKELGGPGHGISVGLRREGWTPLTSGIA